MELNFRNLRADEIEVRVQKATDKGLILLLYKNARCDMNLLDETVGAFRWKCDYKEIKGHMYCGIAIKDDTGEWIWKWDCGSESNQDSEKGEASDSFKRAGFRFGIGRALYTSPFIYFPASKIKDKYDRFKVTDIVYHNNRISSVAICDITAGTTLTFSADTEIIEPTVIDKQLSTKKQNELTEAFKAAGYTDINSLLGKYKHGSLAEFTEAEYKDALSKLKGAKNGD